MLSPRPRALSHTAFLWGGRARWYKSRLLLRGDHPLQVGLPLTGRTQAVPREERNADHPPAGRREEAPLEERVPVGFAHTPAVGQQEVSRAVHLDRDA